MFEVYAGGSQRMTLSEVAAHAQRAEAMGYDGLNVAEAVHDGLLLAQAALAATTRIKVATSVLVVFPRSPMTTAIAAWDLQAMSGGRFELGMGPQVRGNIVKRYGTPWTAPAPRMREYVNVVRAIFDCWQIDAPLDFVGEHYQITRMQPFFNPGPLDSSPPPIILGAVGPNMTALAGEVADRMVTHPTNTAPRYIREVIRPSLERGAARVGRPADACTLTIAPPTCAAPSAAEVKERLEHQRELLTFLFSTPSYWNSLELFGWKERGESLNQLTRENKWDEMAGVIDDEMLATFVPSGTYEELPDVLAEWYGGLCRHITFPMPEDPREDAAAAASIARLKQL